MFGGLIFGGAYTWRGLDLSSSYRDRSHVRSCPERSIQTFVFCPSLLLSVTKTFIPAALLCTRGDYFRSCLSISACAIEAQHSNENCSTLNTARGLIKELLLLLLSSHNVCLESLGPGSNHDPGALGDSQFLD